MEKTDFAITYIHIQAMPMYNYDIFKQIPFISSKHMQNAINSEIITKCEHTKKKRKTNLNWLMHLKIDLLYYFFNKLNITHTHTK